MLERHAPEPACREARLDHAGRPDPQARQHRIGQRVGVKQRQIGLVHVALMQVLVHGIDLGAPQRVGMRPQHRLGTGRGAGGVLHAAGGGGIGGAPGPVGGIGEQGLETVVAAGDAMRGRAAGVMRDHGQPAQVPAMRRDHLRIGRLRDRSDRAAMIGEILHFRRCRAGVGGHRDGAELDAGEPGEHRLDAVVEMNQDEFTRLDAALGEAGGKRADMGVKFAVGPWSCRCIERRPDQERMLTPCFRRAFSEARARPSRQTARRCPGRPANPPCFLPCSFLRLHLARSLTGSSATGMRGPQLNRCTGRRQGDAAVRFPLARRTKSRSGCRRGRGNRPSAACRGRPAWRRGLPRWRRRSRSDAQPPRPACSM